MVLVDEIPRVYSPSSTDKYLTCPMSWWLGRISNVQPIEYSFMELAGIVGTSFSIYMEHLFDSGAETAHRRAHSNLETEHKKLRASNRVCFEQAKAFESQLAKRLDRFIDTYMQFNPIPPTWKLFDPERVFERAGGCRVDTMARTDVGKLAVVDYKTRSRINANQVESTRAEFAVSHQLLHYAWAASQEYNEDVSYTAICCIALEPRAQAHFWVYPVQPRMLAAWSAGMKNVWADMEAVERGERTPNMSSVHSNKYGNCRYHSLCFNYNWDFARAQHHFIQLAAS